MVQDWRSWNKRTSGDHPKKKIKLATVVKGNQKTPFSIATTPRCRGGHYSFPWVAPLYPSYVPYNAECSARRYQVQFLKSLVWRNLGLNPGLPDHWWTLYSLGQCIFTNPSSRSGYDTRSIFKRSLTGLNSEFSFSYTSCLSKAVEISLPYYLPIAGRRIIGFIPFPRVLVLCKIQLAWSRIWTRVVVSISYDDNHYTTNTSLANEPVDHQNYSIIETAQNTDQVIPIRVGVGLGVITLRGYSIFSSVPLPGVFPSDCLVSYTGHSLEGSFTPLQRYSWCILRLQPTVLGEVRTNS